MCLYPKIIKNRKYLPTKKNNGNVPVLNDPRCEWLPVGCGKCIECMKQKSRNWYVRLQEEIKVNHNGKFVVLTFSNESIYNIINGISIEGKNIYEPLTLTGYDLDNEIATIALRYFLERWRKKYSKSLKHWCVTELGHEGTENIHIHGILFPEKEYINAKTGEIISNGIIEDISKIWAYGFAYIGDYVNESSITYITKYVTKIDKQHTYYQPKILTSPGIGKNFLKERDSKNNKFKGKETNENYKNKQGYKMNLPTYYRNKIYTEEEREELWINKLDKQERYVCGERIDISKTEDEYYKILEYYRIKNKILGYGNNKINWDKKKYEQQRRNLKIKERISNTNALRLLNQ